MRRILQLTIGITIVAAFAGVMVYSDVSTSKHNLSTSSTEPDKASTEDQICVFCHTPHNSLLDSGTPIAPLWNHNMSAATNYGVYDSPTLQASIANGGDIADIDTGVGVSNLCMSCHDGTVGVNDAGTGLITWNGGNVGGATDAAGLITSSANLGSGVNALTNDHPINFTYDAALATADGELFSPLGFPNFVDAASAGSIPLFSGKLQCASCHDPHDDTYAPFLVVDNTGSNLCTQCHLK